MFWHVIISLLGLEEASGKCPTLPIKNRIQMNPYHLFLLPLTFHHSVTWGDRLLVIPNNYSFLYSARILPRFK